MPGSPTGADTLHMPITLLIQGGIASGKSTITKLLVERGAEHVDCDRLGHLQLEVPEVRDAVSAQFGGGVLDAQGAIDRAAVAKVVFADPDALRWLEALVHPRIGAAVREALDAARTPPGTPRRVVVIDAAVASKMPLVDRYDAIVFVEADLETRRQRARTRGWEPGELERREQRQDPPAQVRERADTVIPNQGNLEEAKSHVERFWAERVEPLR